MVVKKMMVAAAVSYCLNWVEVEVVALVKKKMAVAAAVHHKRKLFVRPLR